MAQNTETLKFVEDPEEYHLKMDKALMMPLGLEYVVTVESEGEKYEACIPAATIVAEDPPVVSGTFVGTLGDRQVIVFPPSSLGTSIWHISARMLETIRRSAE